MTEDADKPKCFIAMPITTPDDRLDAYGHKDHFRHVLESLFVPAVEAAGFEPIRPHFAGSPVIQASIIKNLIEADLVLCDMSILNANVFFELGVRTALNKPVAMVRDSLTPRIPFDIGPVSAHEYDGTLYGPTFEDQRNRLAEHLRQAAAGEARNEMWHHFGITQVAIEPSGDSELASIKALLVELLADRYDRQQAHPYIDSDRRAFMNFLERSMFVGPPAIQAQKSDLELALAELGATLDVFEIDYAFDAYTLPGTIIVHLPSAMPPRDLMVIQVVTAQIGQRFGFTIDLEARTT